VFDFAQKEGERREWAGHTPAGCSSQSKRPTTGQGRRGVVATRRGERTTKRERGRGASLAGRGEKSSVLDGPPATVQQEQIRPSLAQLDGAR
jgi:hypothetical protein